MTDAAAATSYRPAGRRPEIVALTSPEPSLEELFTFMRDAELRVRSLQLRIVDRRIGTAGEADETSEVSLRQPGRAKVVTRRGPAGGSNGVSRDYDIWLTDGSRIWTYDARARTRTERPVRGRPVGVTNPSLPSFARVYVPLTPLPMETLAETFIHPHGFCRNVLATADVRLLGATEVPPGREAFLLAADHPRATLVLTDRPDRTLDVAVDAMTGIILQLVERIGDRVTRDARVTDLELDPPLGDEIFALHLSEGVRALY